ncbi:hypothetical protein [Marinilabilia salmonicolor]|uniref:hypothetical protein n=1 Tax=Marinilabilia salmonicolor TaxID=989 RepID=UPI000299E644|nr:hypothetical protein [Marinilabilia salmonicolor]
MNKIVLENTRDVPLTTDLLAFMQASYSALEKLAAIGGDNFIVSGCTVSGSTATSGWMVLKGKLVPFKGGSIQTNVRIITTENVYPVGAGSETEIVYTAEFGTSSDTSENVPWADITRGKVNSNIDRLDALENLEWVQLPSVSTADYTADASNAYISKTASGEIRFKGTIVINRDAAVPLVQATIIPESYRPSVNKIVPLVQGTDELDMGNAEAFINPTSGSLVVMGGSYTIHLDNISYYL